MPADISPGITLADLYEAQARACPLCGKPLVLGHFANRDHVYPRSSTGRGLINNIALTHDHCNSAKAGQQPPPEYVAAIEAIYLSLGVTPFIKSDTGERITAEELEDRAWVAPADLWDDVPL